MFYKTVLMCLSLVSSAFSYSSLAKEKASNCVYWKVQKSQFFFMDEDVTGKSCEVSLGLVRTSKNTISVRVEVPIVSFDSGIEARDEDVFSILGGNLQPNIAVETSQMSKEDLRKTVDGSQKSIIGVLQLAGKGYPVEIVFREKGRGYIKTAFTKLGMEPPSVFLGMLADVGDEIKLEFEFNDMSDLSL